MTHFFVSYNHVDSQFVNDLVAHLATERILTWTDRQLRAGDEWKTEIDLAIEKSAGVIVVIAPEALASPYVTYEWSYAKGLGKPVVPVLLRDISGMTIRVLKTDVSNVVYERAMSIHPRLEDIQHVDFRTVTESSWAKLISDLRSLLQNTVPPQLEKYWHELENPDQDTRKNVIKALEDIEDDDADNLLARAIKETKFLDVREGCALALARRTQGTDPRVLPGLRRFMNMWFNQPDVQYALDVVCGFDTDEAIEFQMIALKNDDDQMKIRAARALGKNQATKAADELLKIATNSSWNVRAAAISALEEMKDNRVVECISETVRAFSNEVQSPDATFLRLLADTLVSHGDPGIEAAVNSISSNSRTWNGIVMERLQTCDQDQVKKYVIEREKTLPRDQRAFWEQDVKRRFGICG